MRIRNQATKVDIQLAFNWISSLLGTELDKRVAAFQQQERNNPLLATHFREHFALEFALANARKYRKNTGRLPKGGDYEHLYGFLIPAHRIHQALAGATRPPFEGRLRAALNGAHGIRPFAYEISIATHLMQKNWDVEFADYAGLGQFDILARRGNIEIEVECKTTSGDTGRKIHRQEVNRLADLILPTTQRLADEPGCHLLHVTILGRLGKSAEELASIAATIEAAAQQKSSTSDRFSSTKYRLADLSSWPDARRDLGFREFFEQQFGVTNSHLLLHQRPHVSVVAVAIKSAQADTVVDTIASQAKEAADQCSGTRPAVIALHFIDPMAGPELETLLKTPNGLHTIAAAVFTRGSRQHIDSIAFTVPQQTKSNGRGSTWLSGEGVILHNPQPQFACDEARTLFRPNDGTAHSRRGV
jgi:hypothetical protein